MKSLLNYISEATNNNNNRNALLNFLTYTLKNANIPGFRLDNKDKPVNGTVKQHPGQIRVLCNKDVEENVLDNVNNYITKQSNNSIIFNILPISGSGRYGPLYSLTVTDMSKINSKLFGKYECTFLYTRSTKGFAKITTNNGKTLIVDISNAEFTPQKFGIISNKNYHRLELYAQVLSAIKSAPSNSNIVLFEKYLLIILKKAFKNDQNASSNFSPHSNDSDCHVLELNEITQSHLDAINKGFGEITCALRTLYNIDKEGYRGSAIIYPKEGQGLYDFKLLYGKGGVWNEKFYSVKNKGLSSSTAMSNILPMLIRFEEVEDTSALGSDYQLFKKCITRLAASAKGIPLLKNNPKLAIDIDLNNRSVRKNSIETANIYASNSDKLTKLLNVFKNIFGISDTTYESFESCLINCKNNKLEDNNNLNRYAEGLYKFYNSIDYNTKSEFGIGTSKTVDTVEKIKLHLMNGDKAFGLITEPICKILAQEMNNNEKMIEYLNKVLSSAGGSVYQIETHISIKNGNVNYIIDEKDIKNFKTYNFKFFSHSMRTDDGNNVSMGFKMVEDINDDNFEIDLGEISIIHNKGELLD